MRRLAAAVAAIALVFAVSACEVETEPDPSAGIGQGTGGSDESEPEPESDLTPSQKAAVESATSYLTMGTGFSEKGLLSQLTSDAGEGFAKKDALFAIKYLKVDWKKQAVMSAKNYVEMGGFSRSGLIEQLTSSAGEQFTKAQAVYAVNKVGL